MEKMNGEMFASCNHQRKEIKQLRLALAEKDKALLTLDEERQRNQSMSS